MSQGKSSEVVEFVPTNIYSQRYILRVFCIAKATLGRWHKAGLKQLNTHTNESWYLGADIIRFFEELSGNDDSR